MYVYLYIILRPAKPKLTHKPLSWRFMLLGSMVLLDSSDSVCRIFISADARERVSAHRDLFDLKRWHYQSPITAPPYRGE
jgi:hypothetical protein